ncbi:carbohydrate porin [Oxalobacteraceae bacterium]|nr:carbohydrate porin [Oxalobacteraceae bacterium]
MRNTRNTCFPAMPLALALALACGGASADDVPGFHGYLRAGAGVSSTHGPQSCFSLGGNTVKYRLGNECDGYTKFGYTQEVVKTDGVSFVGTLWVNAYSNQSDIGSAKLGINKAYIEAKGLDFLGGGAAWIGLRDYLWSDIHMLDMWYILLNGSSTGGGFDKIPAGPGKFSYAVFQDNDTTTRDAAGKMLASTSATRHNFIYQELPVNPGGTLEGVVTLVNAVAREEKHNGWQATVSHKQAGVLGGLNTFVVQYGVGPGTGTGRGNGNNYDRVGPSGSTSLGSDVRQLRVFDHLWIQPIPFFGIDMVALMQRDRSDAGGSTTWTSLGARPVYALSNTFKLQMEVGVDRVTSPTGGEAKRLTKITFAPTISAGPGLWARPELRAFVTYGKWNKAATASVNASNASGPVYNNDTSGASVGIQVETWF